MESKEGASHSISILDVIYSFGIFGMVSLIGIGIWQWGNTLSYLQSLFSFEHFWSHIGIGLIVGIVITLLVVVLHHLLKITLFENKYIKVLKELIMQPYGPLVIGVFPGIFEELLFRGFLLPLAMSWFGVVWGVVIVSIVFFALHLPQYQNNLKINLIVLSLSFALTILFVYTKTLWAPILTHVIYNFTMCQFAKRRMDQFFA